MLFVAAAICIAPAARAETVDGGPSAAEKSREDDIFGGGNSTPADAGTNASSSREDEMFGGGSTSADGGTKPSNREDEMFGNDSTKGNDSTPGNPPPTEPSETDKLAPIDQNALVKRAEDANNHLTIGGLFYLRAEYAQREGVAPHTIPVSMPNFMDLYFDARPNDDLRAYVRGRMSYNPAASGGTANQLTPGGALGQAQCTSLCLNLDQFWVKTNAAHKVFFTLGRQRIKWGTGRFWNPTDFMNQTRRNPLDIIDLRFGVNLFKIHIPIESKAWNFYGIINAENATALDALGFALRGEFVAGPAEFSLTAAYRDRQPLKLGGDVSMGLGDLDWHAEVAVLHPVKKGQIVILQGGFVIPGDIVNNFDKIQTPASIDHDGEWLPQIVVGGEYPIKYTDQDSLVLGLEYFYNALGYDAANLYPLLFQNGGFNPLYNGRHYGAAYLSLPSPGNWNNTTFLVSWIGNLSDNSHLARFDWRQTVLTWMQTSFYASYAFGSSGELHFNYSIPQQPAGTAAAVASFAPQFVPLVSQLEKGPLVINANSWVIGGGIILTL